MEPPETNDCIIDEDELELEFKKLLDEPPISIFFSSMFLICNNHDKHVVLSTYYGYLKEFVEILKNCREVEFNLCL
uniref:Uncharacterized protein n=1 Tax=Acrobeloides nanus TaxID=290746 RepID=A0A914CA89_9BILA